MIHKLVKKLHRSIFTKVLLIFTAAYILIMMAEVSIHHLLFKEHQFKQILRNAVNYSRFLADEIGYPPNIETAYALSQSQKIGISISSENFQWQSDSTMAEVDVSELVHLTEFEEAFAGFSSGLYVSLQKDGFHYLFQIHKKGEGFLSRAEIHLILSLLFAMLIILTVFLIVRWQLKPIKALEEGVSQLSRGNFEYQTPVSTEDELGQLIRSFNDMRQQIWEMIRSREQLMLDVSHELRSPLTRVKIALEFMQECKSKQSIVDDVAEMEKMVTTILETERLNSPHGGLELHKIDLHTFIEDIMSEFKGQAPGIRLLEFDDTVKITGDGDRLSILFRNIFSNALKYSPDSAPVEVSLRRRSGEVVIAVQDFGPGIPENELPYVMQPFYRVDKSRSKKTGGYGLGMSLSKKIAEAHGGRLEISSKEGIGTTVFIIFKV